jgi:saccharopine dehydrogenase-like NADP-dependent oxidoreductase
MRNYNSLIIGGFGSVGTGLAKLGDDVLIGFNRIYAIDNEQTKLDIRSDLDISFILGDIQDISFLQDFLNKVDFPAIFVNLCPHVDNIILRKFLSRYPVAYIDSCVSAISGNDESCISRLMSYTNSFISSRYPHLVCWGINPGMVEIIARMIIKDCFSNDGMFDVSVFEHDQLIADFDNSMKAVGWSPCSLVDEFMLTPSYQIQDGEEVEAEENRAGKIVAFWEGQKVKSGIVAHEDIWNIGNLLAGINSARFIYGLQPGVMKLLEGSPDEAMRLLKIPEDNVPVYGWDRIAVEVGCLRSGRKCTLLWETNHHQVWEEFRVNAVQYQTAKSLLFAVKLVQQTHYGHLKNSHCASNLPIRQTDWQIVKSFMDDLDIIWNDGKFLGLDTISLGGV